MARDTPDPGPGEALIRISLAGVCGTDLAIDRGEPWIVGGMRLPVVVGHEGMGVVEELGPGTTRVSVGDRVGIETHIPCGSCRNCLTGRQHICTSLTYVGTQVDGIFARHAVLAENLLFPLPDELPDEIAAILEPFGLAIRAVKSGVGVDAKTVLVTGLGPIGTMSCLLARRFGASRVIASEVIPYRLSFARDHGDELGIDRVVDASSENVATVVRDLTNGDGADVWIDFAGGEHAFAQGLDALRPGGEAHLVAPVNGTTSLTPLILKEITAHGLHGRLIYDTWFDAVSVATELRGILARLITTSFPLSEFERAFDVAHERKTMKLMLEL